MQSYWSVERSKENAENWYRDIKKNSVSLRNDDIRMYIFEYLCTRACLITTLIQGKIRFDRAAICKVHDSICEIIFESTSTKLIRRAKGRKSIKRHVVTVHERYMRYLTGFADFLSSVNPSGSTVFKIIFL